MANDRLYLRCRQCGAMISISKHFLTPWYIHPEKLEEINQFFEDHWFCEEAKYNTAPNSFELVSEMGDGFPEDESEVMYHSYDIFTNDYDTEQIHRQEAYKKEKELSDRIARVYGRNKE